MTDDLYAEQKDEKRPDMDALGEVKDLQWLMQNKRGRRIVRRWLEQAGVYRLSFNTNALTMAFNEGGRNLGNRLLALVTEHCPAQYAELLNEAKEK